MALEMRVYDELTAVDPKIMAGMTTRQLLAVAVLAVVEGGTLAVLWLTGHKALMQPAMVLIAIPIAVWGWIKPFGLRAEVYLQHVRAFFTRPRNLTYSNPPLWKTQQRDSYEGKNVVTRQKSQRDRVTEAGR